MENSVHTGCVARTTGGVQLTLAEAVEWCATSILPEEPYLRAIKEHPDALQRYVLCPEETQREWRRWSVSVWVGPVEVMPYSVSMNGEIIVEPRSAIGGRTYSAEETEQLLRHYTIANMIIQSAIAITGRA